MRGWSSRLTPFPRRSTLVDRGIRSRDSRHRRPGTAFLAKQKLPAPSARGVAHAPSLLLPVSAARASVSVLVRVPYSPPRRSGRGGTPIPVDV